MLREKRKNDTGEMPTSSMADIALLLLIFFIVTTTINTDKGIGMILPKWGDQLDVPKENIVNVLINAAGEVMIAEDPTPIPLIQDNIRKRLAANENLIISIKPSRETEYSVVITVLDQIKLSGAMKKTLAEIDSEEKEIQHSNLKKNPK